MVFGVVFFNILELLFSPSTVGPIFFVGVLQDNFVSSQSPCCFLLKGKDSLGLY